MAEEIIIDIHPNGDVTFEGKGFQGGECKKLTKALEDAVGSESTVKLKPEYRQVAKQAKKLQR